LNYHYGEEAPRGRKEHNVSPAKSHPVHSREILAEEFLKPLEISQRQFAAHIGVKYRSIEPLIVASVASRRIRWRLAQALRTVAGVLA